MVKVIETIDGNTLFKYNCSMCGKQNVIPINIPTYVGDVFCSVYCKVRDQQIKERGYPEISDNEYMFWTSIIGHSKQDQKRTKGPTQNKQDQKLVKKRTKKQDQHPPYRGLVLWSSDPVLEMNLGPLLEEQEEDLDF